MHNFTIIFVNNPNLHCWSSQMLKMLHQSHQYEKFDLLALQDTTSMLVIYPLMRKLNASMLLYAFGYSKVQELVMLIKQFKMSAFVTSGHSYQSKFEKQVATTEAVSISFLMIIKIYESNHPYLFFISLACISIHFFIISIQNIKLWYQSKYVLVTLSAINHLFLALTHYPIMAGCAQQALYA